MRIIYHHRTASRDGQSTHIEEMVRALREAGHEVILIGPTVADAARAGARPHGVARLKRVLPRLLYELMELGYSVIAYRRLAAATRAHRPDAIYERYNLFLLAGVWVRARYRVPLILEVNSPNSRERCQYGGLALRRMAAWTERHVWRHADAILPITEVMAELITETGVPRERMVVIPNGIDLRDYEDVPSVDEAKQRLGLGGRFVIGFTGFVREWDQLERIVRWLATRSGHRTPHLLIVGDGPARAGAETCARELGIADRLTFTGVVPRKQVPVMAAAFDIALQTALVPYASPLCLFEYLALGKAIVAPRQPNHQEILCDGVDALLYDPADPNGIEVALDALCDDAELRERLASRAAHVITERQLTWAHHAKRVTALVERLIGAGSVRGEGTPRVASQSTR